MSHVNLQDMLDAALTATGDDRIAILREAVERFPQSFEALLALAYATLDIERETAVRSLEQAGQLPLSPDDLFRAASVWTEAERYKEAWLLLRRIVDEHDPDDAWELWPSVTWLMGMLCWRRGGLELAERFLRQSYGLAPDNVEAALALLDLFVEQQRFDEVESFLAELPDDMADSPELRRFIRRWPARKRGRWVARRPF